MVRLLFRMQDYVQKTEWIKKPIILNFAIINIFKAAFSIIQKTIESSNFTLLCKNITNLYHINCNILDFSI